MRYQIFRLSSGSNEIGDTPRKYRSIFFVRCQFIEAFLVLQEQRELKIHSEAYLASELAEAVPAESEVSTDYGRIS